MSAALEQAFVDCRRMAKDKPGEWGWKQLQHGALVALRVRPDKDGRFELRIARKQEGAPDERWETEIQTFLKAFRIEQLDGLRPCTTHSQYHRHTQKHENGVVETLLIELRRGECKVGRALCFACLIERGERVEIPWWPHGSERGQRCDECARSFSERLPATARESNT